MNIDREHLVYYGLAGFGLLLVAALWVAVFALLLEGERAETMGKAMSLTRNLANAFEEHTVRVIGQADQTVTRIRRTYEREGGKLTQGLLAEEHERLKDTLSGVVVADAKGNIVLSSVSAPPANISDQEHFRIHVERDSGSLFIGKPVAEREPGRWSMQVTRRLSRPDGSFAGVAGAAISLNKLGEFYRRLDVGRGGVIVLVGRDGIVRVRQAGEEFSAGQQMRGRSRALASIDAGDTAGSHTIEASPNDGLSRVVSFRALSAYPLIVLVAVSQDEALQAFNQRRLIYLAYGVIATLLIGGCLVVIGRYVWQQQKSRQAQVQTQYFMEKAQEVAHIGYWVSGPAQEGVKLVWSAESHRIFGISEGAFDGRVETFFSLVHPDDLQRVKAESLVALTGKRPYRVEHRIVRPDGAVRWVYQEADIRFDSEGKPVQMFGVVQDITERRGADLLVRESERRYRYMFEGNPMPMWVRDALNGRFLAVNEATMALYGYTREEFSRLAGEAIRPAEDRLAWLEFIGRRDPMQHTVRRWRHRKKNGEIIDVEVTSQGFVYEGRPARLGLIKDITEQMRAERALRESEERFRAAFEQAAVGMALRDVDPRNPRWLRVNQKLCDILGYGREELLQMTSIELTPDDDRQQANDFNEQLLRGDRTSYTREKRYVRKDGRTIWVNASLTAVRETDGRPTHVLSVIEDITERKLAEQALREGEERYRKLIEMSPSPMVLRRGDFVDFANPAALRFFGASREGEIVGRRYLDLVHPDDHERVRQRMVIVDSTEEHTPIEVRRFRRVDGETVIGETSGVGMPFQGRIIGIVAIHDVTDRMRVEQALRDSDEQMRRYAADIERLNAELELRVAERTRQLELVNQELESFAYSVSHDLRAPLRSIDGFSKALLEDYESRLDQDGRDYLNRVRKATQRMAALIDDLLALSRVGRMEMRAERMNLGTLAGEIVEELKRQEPARKVDVRIEPALTARGDSSLMRIALQNLLQNAWKFTSRTAAARIEVGKSSHNGNDTFFVRDNGVGFDMAYAGKLFGAFQRLHAESEFPGTGIGLATVQRIIRRHGGEVRAQAVVGEGTTIFFTLGAGRPSDDPGARG